MKVARAFLIGAIMCVGLSTQVSAASVISNTKLLNIGCYKFVDLLENTNPGNQNTLPGNNLGPQTSSLPDAYLGKELTKVSCFTKHHVEVSLVSKSPMKGTIKLDTVMIRSRCLINNIAIANPGHESHSSQMYANVWRIGKTNYFNCGIVGASSVVPSAPKYKIFQEFYSPVLKLGA